MIILHKIDHIDLQSIICHEMANTAMSELRLETDQSNY